MPFTDLVSIGVAGLQIPDYPAVLDYLQTEYRAIYGDDIYLGSDTQDGQWIAIQALALYDMCLMLSKAYNGFSPTTAQADALSRVVKINGLARQLATPSTVDLVVTGTGGTVITNGVARDAFNNRWALPTTVTIPVGGSITVTSTCQIMGTINANANTVNIIDTPQLGWQTINNPQPAMAGKNLETDAELRKRQALSTALPSKTVIEGILGGILSVDGVTQAKIYENPTATTDGNGIPPHGIACIVQGGINTDIAEVVYRKATLGMVTTGAVAVVKTDKYGLQKTIRFARPTIATVGVTITLTPLIGWTTTVADQIKASIVAYINGLTIGETVYLSRIYSPANLAGTAFEDTFNITAITMNKNGGSFTASNVAIAYDELATTAVANITVTVVP